MVVAPGLVSVSPGLYQGGRLSGRLYRLAGLIGGCPGWVSRCVPLVCLCRSLRVVFAAVLIAFCSGGWAAYRVRVVCWSVVRLPLVCASGVLLGLHSLPFYLSVFGLGVPLWCVCSVCLVCVWSGCVPHIFAPTLNQIYLHSLSIRDN